MIDALTSDQEMSLREYREECLRSGHSCAPSDRAAAETAFRGMYARLGRGQPRVWWCDGPATGSILRDLLGASPGPSLGASPGASPGASLGASLRANLGASLRASHWWSCWGQHEIYWPAFYDWPDRFLRKMYGEKDRALLDMWLTLGKSTGWWQPYENGVVACERPERQALDAEGRLPHRVDHGA